MKAAKMTTHKICALAVALAAGSLFAAARDRAAMDLEVASMAADASMPLQLPQCDRAIESLTDSMPLFNASAHEKKVPAVSIYALPYSLSTESRDWKRLWINTAVLTGAFVGTLAVLECLPEDATSWNRAALQKDPPEKRWFNNIFKRGPEWDHDNPIFNFVLHPYAGAAYFMAARSCGFNFYRSLLYCACISTIGWEFGIEACMERPSYQDLVITPVVGSLIGEGFYRLKRKIVENGYEVAGSRFLGGFVAFLIDPVNEVIGLFAGNPARKAAAEFRLAPSLTPYSKGLSLSVTF